MQISATNIPLEKIGLNRLDCLRGNYHQNIIQLTLLLGKSCCNYTFPLSETTLRVCSFRRIQKRIFDPRFARFRGRKEREIRNWICNLGNLSPTRAICTTASQKMTCFLLFDKLCDYTVQNLVVGSFE